MRKLCLLSSTSLIFATSLWASVTVSSPSNGAHLPSPVLFQAKASSSGCSRGVASMAIYVDGKLAYKIDKAALDTKLKMKPGKHSVVTEEWDHCGNSTEDKQTLTVTATVASPSISVVSPANNSVVTSPATYIAAASVPSCAAGVASIEVYVDGELAASQPGPSLNAQVALGSGIQKTIVKELDKCGGSLSKPITVSVEGAPSVLSSLQASPGWVGWGQQPPDYQDCSPCSGISWSMTQGITSPSLSQNAAQFSTNGSVPFAVVLWENPVLGQMSTQGLPDKSHTLIPGLHHFTYEGDFYLTNTAYTHALELDVAMYLNGVSMFWGTQCDQGGDGQWDALDKGGKGWVKTGVPCEFNTGWNHFALEFQRESGNKLLYKSITLNGVTKEINVTYNPTRVPTSWYGVTVNYQMDGDKFQDPNTTYVDNLTLAYW